MIELRAALAPLVADWRDAGHPHDRYRAIGEIPGFALEGPAGRDSDILALPIRRPARS